MSVITNSINNTSNAFTSTTFLTATSGHITASAGNIIATLGDVIISAGKIQVGLSTGSDGQVLIAATGAAPAWATISAGTGISITAGTNTLSIASSAPAVTWTVATTDLTMAAMRGYVNKNATPANKTLFTLPAVAAIGDTYSIIGFTTGGFRVVQQANQSIQFGATSSTVGAAGYVEFIDQHDCITIVCITANTGFAVVSSQGNFTVA